MRCWMTCPACWAALAPACTVSYSCSSSIRLQEVHAATQRLHMLGALRAEQQALHDA
jgi:hypothetical protein